jgi:probable rRNA maturation factor
MVIFETAVNGMSAARMQLFVRQAQRQAKVAGEVDILISSNKRLQELNRRFRRKNKPTDVLSFPRPTGGDIAISAEIAQENAARYGHATADELKILVLHGMLHLAGYDHESDNGQMARTEAHLRARLKLPASLIHRTHASTLRDKTAVRRTTKPRKLKARKLQATRPSKARRRSPQ